MVLPRFLAAAALALCLALSQSASAEGNIPELNTDSFVNTVSHASGPVLIEFKAKWCPYCKKQQGDIEALRQSHAGTLDVFQVDVDNEPDIAADFEAHILPTLIIIYHGVVVGRSEGALYGNDLTDWVQDVEKDIAAKKSATGDHPQPL